MQNILKAALFTPTATGWGLPVCLWGEPGTAKTHMVLDLAAEVGLPVVTLSPRERGDAAYGVVPVPQGGYLTYPPPDWVRLVDPAGLVFLDEFNLGDREIEAAQLGLVHGRRIGAHTLSPRVRILLAANPPECATGGRELAPPTANRMGHILWSAPSTASWFSHMTGGGGFSTLAPAERTLKLEYEVQQEYDAAYHKALPQLFAFIKAIGKLHALPKRTDPARAYAWPSPRSWDNAVRALASARVHKLSADETVAFVGGFIGTPLFVEFLEYLEKLDLPDPAELLAKRNPNIAKLRLDRQDAVLGSCVSYMHTIPNPEPELGAKFWALCDTVPADVVLQYVESILQHPKLGGHPDAAPLLQRLMPALRNLE